MGEKEVLSKCKHRLYAHLEVWKGVDLVADGVPEASKRHGANPFTVGGGTITEHHCIHGAPYRIALPLPSSSQVSLGLRYEAVLHEERSLRLA